MSDSKIFLPPEIFKAYDIRGIVGQTLKPEIVFMIGQALGTLAHEKNQEAIAVGRDGRLSSPAISQALIEGILASGMNALDIGAVPTPVTYFAARNPGISCVSVTGSHNPPEYNGLKMVIAGETLALNAIQSLKKRIGENALRTGKGQLETLDIRETYLEAITSRIRLSRPMKIALDCGNGIAGEMALSLFKRLGCGITPLYCEADGNFPHHHPDPSRPENLVELIRVLKEGDAEIGLAMDGDGDRLGVVAKDGEIIFPDRLLMLYAQHVLSDAPESTVIYDVKCTRLLAPWIRQHSGTPLMWNTGHALIKAKMKETGAVLAGEMSGHLFFKDRWFGFDDALYAGARLLEILSGGSGAFLPLKSLPSSISTPELNIKMAEGEPFALINALQTAPTFPGEIERIIIDGIRVEYPDGFGLARASNTTPVIVLRFEADNKAAMARIQDDFRSALLFVRPDLALPF